MAGGTGSGAGGGPGASRADVRFSWRERLRVDPRQLIPTRAGAWAWLLGIARYGGAITAFTLLFFVAAWMSLPMRAIEWRISHELKQRGYLMEVRGLWISPFGRVFIDEVEWTFKPSRADQLPSTFLAEDVDVRVRPLSLLAGGFDVSVSGVIDEGTFSGRFAKLANESVVTAELDGVPLYALPKAQQAFNAPMLGTARLAVDLRMPEHKFVESTGTIELACLGCRFGDGETKAYMGTTGLLAKGLTIPEIEVGDLVGKMDVAEGLATFVEPMRAEGDDLEVLVEGTVRFKDPFKRTVLDLTLKVRFTEALQERSDAIRLLAATASPATKLDPPDEGMGYRFRGPIAKAKLTGIKSATAEDRKRAKREKARRDAAQRENQRNDAAKRPPPPLPPPPIPPVVEPLPPEALPDPNAAAAADAAAQAGEPPVLPADDGAVVVGEAAPEPAAPADAPPPEPPPAPPADEPPPAMDEPAVVFPADGFDGAVDPAAPPNE